ncbi:universal stress protein UspA [Haladaptatus sp. R4]|uniref:universal stress protein n=1 Tax=Haladaptatus sp. R4 TaxID=1679489 RepID=UPI0007B4E61E|nr:universal stress protein [Haladaptatus sp. R4]KZN23637.1 universal stress protein UspA [Haladaptatus sp. R4]
MGGYLVAIDGSGASMDALRYALDLARSTGQSVTAVHVVVPEEIVAADDVPPTSFAEANRDLILSNVEDAETHGQELLDDAAAAAEREGTNLDTGLLYGEPVQEITEYADDNGYDAIFVGHRGASERFETLFGSVAKNVAGRATVPVTIVR